MAPFMHTRMPYHYQNNNGTPYATGNISGQGCAPTAVSMAVSFLLGRDVSVNELISWNDGYANGRTWANTMYGGSYPGIVAGNAKHYGLDYYYVPKTGTSYEDAQRIVTNALKLGMPIVVIVGNGYGNLFTAGEHYITLSGYQKTTGKNCIWVHNPNSIRHLTNEVQAHEFKKVWDLIPRTYGFYILYKMSKYNMIYDRSYYLTHQEDRKKIEEWAKGKAGKNANQEAINKQVFWHFVKHGTIEGRTSSPYFKVTTYKNKYKDLQNSFGKDNVLYYAHYIDYGMKEGRTAYSINTDNLPEKNIKFDSEFSKVFDVNYYYNKYVDLQKAFNKEKNKDYEYKLMMHFINYGMRQGRIASDKFDIHVYKSRPENEDLRKAFKDNLESYFRHYFRYGCHEGRICQNNSLPDPWQEGTKYAKDDKVTHIGSIWESVIDKNAQEPYETFSKQTSPKYWKQILSEWDGRNGLNAYKMGEKVLHNGKIWISLIDDNIEEPSEKSFLWQLVE